MHQIQKANILLLDRTKAYNSVKKTLPWKGRGGRDLGKAPAELVAKRAVAEKACGPGETLNDRLKNVDYKKPNCIGNPLFSFFRDRMTPEERDFV